MPDTVEDVVRSTGASLKEQLATRTGAMITMFVEAIPEFHHDDEVEQLMVASTSSNLTAIVDMLALGISLDDITVPPAAVEYARRFAQHDLSLEGLLRAYRLGEHMFVQWAIADIADLNLPAATALAATSRIALIANSYIDRVIEDIIDIYEDERRRWDTRTDAARAAALKAVLEGPDIDLRAAEQMLSTSLRGWNVAACIWCPGGEVSLPRLLRIGTAAMHDATGAGAMSVSVDDQHGWVWASSAGRLTVDLAALTNAIRTEAGIYLAVGRAASGLAGFRQTFREAEAARKVALTSRRRERVTLHSDVGLASLVVDRLSDVDVWARQVLGGLIGSDDTSARLRETLREFLDSQGSYTDTAARMHVHKNTVHYRVRQAEEQLGRSVNEQRLETEVALLLCEQLGLAG
ncbi:ABC transporter substrate-binding protein [Mycolicibacterium anyangense]|uniref:ABC transporter substrate-binding protein n=1 Tax=Mycolicibacterium anyangense TaxID=1431246 RepID=A0A6N4W6X1_9MYCO|nr:helix-turn-helix domain-containing protein [Mycolicibacterium anyangense]BBZ75834.1 ABC transporter substrate-binding protein [Mycolicibacterium anyangense]